MAFTRDEFTDVTTFGFQLKHDWRDQYRVSIVLLPESNVAVSAYDLATSPDGRYCFFLALGGDDSDNYIVHQKAVG